MAYEHLRPAKSDKPIVTIGTELKYTVSAKFVLVKRANTTKEMDHWSATLTLDNGNAATFDYRTGIGHRCMISDNGMARPGMRANTSTRHGFEHSLPKEPDAQDVLISLGMDLSTALEMPAADAAALDYLESEFGHDGKASELLRMVHALRETLDKLREFIRGTGWTIEQFAAACQELDQ